LLLLLLLLASTALGRPSAADKKEASRLEREADALIKKGEREQAVDKLRAADRLDPGPARKVRLAKVLMDIEQLLEAARVLEQASDARVSGSKDRAAIDKAKKLAADVQERTPTLSVKIHKPEPNLVKVQVDGKSFDPSLGPQPFDPGYHQLLATATGYPDHKQEVTLAERANEVVEISLRKPGEPEDEGDANGKKSGGFSKWPAIISWGLGAIGLGVGVGFGVEAINDTNALLENYDCKDNKCPPEAADDLAAAKVNGNVSTVGFVVGGVGLVAGTILWLLADSGSDKEADAAPSKDAPAGESAAQARLRLRPLIGFGTVGVEGRF